VRYVPEMAGLDEIARAIEAAGYEIRTCPSEGRRGRWATLLDEADAEAAVRAHRAANARLTAAASLVVAAWRCWSCITQRAWTMEQAAWCSSAPQRRPVPGRRRSTRGPAGGRHGTTSMDTLVVVGTSAAWAFSALVRSRRPASLRRHRAAEPTSTARPRSSAHLTGAAGGSREGPDVGAIKALIGCRLDRPNRPAGRDGRALEEVRVGDLVRVPGERVPVDGES